MKRRKEEEEERYVTNKTVFRRERERKRRGEKRLKNGRKGKVGMDPGRTEIPQPELTFLVKIQTFFWKVVCQK